MALARCAAVLREMMCSGVGMAPSSKEQVAVTLLVVRIGCQTCPAALPCPALPASSAPEPCCACSCFAAQVYKALRNGAQPVAVKVLMVSAAAAER